RLTEARHREFQRKATGHQDTALYVLGEIAEMAIAVGQLGPGVADADDRTTIQQVGREALALHPAAWDEAILAGLREPFGAAIGARLSLASASPAPVA